MDFINNNRWHEAITLSTDVFNIIDELNKRNIFHYACIRGNITVIRELLKLKSKSIFNSDIQGNTGGHLLAINGWDDFLLEVVKLEPDFLKLKNRIDFFIFNLVLTRSNTMYEIIDIMKKHDMLSYLDFIRYTKRTFLLDVIDMISSKKLDMKVLKYCYNLGLNFNIPIGNPPLIFSMSLEKSDECFVANYMIMNFDIDFDVQNSYYNTPLIIGIDRKFEDIALLLLDKNVDINYAGYQNEFVPLSIAIKYGLHLVIKKMITNKKLDYNKQDHLLNTPIFYLLDSEYKHDKNIMKKFIKESDLLIKNINGITPLHLLIQTNSWKKYENILINKNIDLNIIDKHKNTPYTLSKDIKSLIKFNEKRILSGNKTVLSKINDIILPDTISGGFGLFSSDSIHSAMYTCYILSKYKSCMIPYRNYVSDKYVWDKMKYNNEMLFIGVLDPFSYIVYNYIESLYCFAPYVIYWKDRNTYYLDENVELYIKRVLNLKHRIIFMKLVISSPESLHANIIIYDRERNTLMRFEPYGDWEFADSYYLDKFIIRLFKKCLDNKAVKTLKYLRPANYLDKTKFQSSSESNRSLSVGDPRGYCLAWSMWFLELKLLNPDFDEKILVETALDKIITSSPQDDNALLTHIRGFAKHLDNEKNRIFSEMQISENEHYKYDYTENTLQLIKTHLKSFIRV